jgi:hypothetical protein
MIGCIVFNFSPKDSAAAGTRARAVANVAGWGHRRHRRIVRPRLSPHRSRYSSQDSLPVVGDRKRRFVTAVSFITRQSTRHRPLDICNYSQHSDVAPATVRVPRVAYRFPDFLMKFFSTKIRCRPSANVRGPQRVLAGQGGV